MAVTDPFGRGMGGRRRATGDTMAVIWLCSPKLQEDWLASVWLDHTGIPWGFQQDEGFFLNLVWTSLSLSRHFGGKQQVRPATGATRFSFGRGSGLV